MTNDQTPPQAPDQLVPQTPRPGGESTSEARAFVEDFVRAAYQGGPNAEFEYEHALRAMAHAPQEVVIEIARALGECRPLDFPRRWALIFAAGELRHPAALPLLATIIQTPLPPEPRTPSHAFSIVGEETILRTTAIEALGHLVSERGEEATAVLFAALRQPSISIRRAAIQALLGPTSDRRMVERIREYLPPEERFLLELKRPKVTDVPQVEHPEQFLSEEAREASTVKSPRLPGRGQTPRTRRPPRSGGKEPTK